MVTVIVGTVGVGTIGVIVGVTVSVGVGVMVTHPKFAQLLFVHSPLAHDLL